MSHIWIFNSAIIWLDFIFFSKLVSSRITTWHFVVITLMDLLRKNFQFTQKLELYCRYIIFLTVTKLVKCHTVHLFQNIKHISLISVSLQHIYYKFTFVYVLHEASISELYRIVFLVFFFCDKDFQGLASTRWSKYSILSMSCHDLLNNIHTLNAYPGYPYIIW